MTSEHLKKYAELLIWAIGGIDGRRLYVKAEPVHRPLVVEISRASYQGGAALVVVDYDEPLLTRARVEYAADEDLGLHAGFEKQIADEVAGDEWSLIRLRGSDEPDYLEGLSADRIGFFSRSAREITRLISETVSRFTKHWVGAVYPTHALAQKACPNLERDEALRRYESEVVRVLGLDREDPVTFWQSTIADLRARRDRFTRLGLDSLHLTGPGTDLEIGLNRGTRWATAEATMPDGRTVFVNMPSLEVFTTPDLRRTSGRVAATRPYLSTSSPGTLIRGAWFRFEAGAVIESGADEGAEVLAKVLEMDEQAKYLGEVALVDSRSPVAQAGFTFFNTLYDENAATHIALGRGFPRFVEGAEDLSNEELIRMGVNHSLVHDDVMIGSEELDIDGVTTGGETVPLMRAGRFVEG